MNQTMKENTITINGANYVGLNGYYTDEVLADERLENFAQLECFFKNKAPIHEYTGTLLYCLRELQKGALKEVQEDDDYSYSNVEQFVEEKREKIATFLAKWWDESKQTLMHTFEIQDARETGEPHEVIFTGDSGYILGIEFYSDKLNQSFWFNYLKGNTYTDGDELQLFIAEAYYEELMHDVLAIFES